jgi:hypothetical protein
MTNEVRYSNTVFRCYTLVIRRSSEILYSSPAVASRLFAAQERQQAALLKPVEDTARNSSGVFGTLSLRYIAGRSQYSLV